MIEDELDEIVVLERRLRAATEAALLDILEGRATLDEASERLRALVPADKFDLVRELLAPIDDEQLTDLVEEIVGGSEVPAASVPGRRT